MFSGWLKHLSDFQNPHTNLTLDDLDWGNFKITKVKMSRIILAFAPRPRVPIDDNVRCPSCVSSVRDGSTLAIAQLI